MFVLRVCVRVCLEVGNGVLGALAGLDAVQSHRGIHTKPLEDARMHVAVSACVNLRTAQRNGLQ